MDLPFKTESRVARNRYSLRVPTCNMNSMHPRCLVTQPSRPGFAQIFTHADGDMKMRKSPLQSLVDLSLSFCSCVSPHRCTDVCVRIFIYICICLLTCLFMYASISYSALDVFVIV